MANGLGLSPKSLEERIKDLEKSIQVSSTTLECLRDTLKEGQEADPITEARIEELSKKLQLATGNYNWLIGRRTES